MRSILIEPASVQPSSGRDRGLRSESICFSSVSSFGWPDGGEELVGLGPGEHDERDRRVLLGPGGDEPEQLVLGPLQAGQVVDQQDGAAPCWKALVALWVKVA